jgi:DNA ligase 1
MTTMPITATLRARQKKTAFAVAMATSMALLLLLFLLVLCASDLAFAKPASPPLILANVWSEDFDPSQYLISEKYDGARALWDGKTLRFRSGRTVNAPDWFIAQLPAEKLDGELWIGRGQFEKLSGAVRKNTPIDDEWREIKYMIFELPDATGTFTERYAAIQTLVKRINSPAIKAVEQIRGTTRDALRVQLNATVKGGGEGLMLHLAEAPYQTGRSDVLLKLKPLADTEARVIAHIPGRGKYKGMLGALRVEMPSGKRFNIGTGFSDDTRKNPPPVGATVTYTYRGLTKTGVPRFASFLRIREAF